MSDSIGNPAETPASSLVQAAIERSRRPQAGRSGGARARIPETEHMELALAWLKSDVTQSSVSAVAQLGTGNSVYTFLALGLRAAYRKGLLKL